MSDNPDVLFREPPELVQVAERVEKRAAPRIAAARGISRLGIPERLAGFKLVAERAVERKRLVGFRQPFLRQCRVRRGLRLRSHGGATDRTCAVVVVGEPSTPGPRRRGDLPC